MSPACSVILTSYERPRHLALVLAGYLRQGAVDFEVIVADDGSGPQTAQVVKDFAGRAPFPVRHVWHERDGHRRTVILNRGIAEGASDYILFSDGDCIPAANLIGSHLARREPDRMLIAGYLRIDEQTASKMDEPRVASGAYERVSRRDRLSLQRRHLKNQWQILRRRRRRPHNLGLNMSVSREALLRVNGFDEVFRGWGNADGDLRERLRMVGVRLKSIWPHALVFHLNHPREASRAGAAGNRAYAKRPELPAFAEQGIEKRERGA